MIVLWSSKDRLNPSIDPDDDDRLIEALAKAQVHRMRSASVELSRAVSDVSDDDEPVPDTSRNNNGTITDPDHAFMRIRTKYKAALVEIRKIEIRDMDTDLEKIAFVYEEYEPRVWWFPVYEAGRRVVMTGVLTMFFPGSLSQVAMGLLFALISHRVYAEFEPYIEDDDDIISEVAQTQLVIIYFAGAPYCCALLS